MKKYFLFLLLVLVFFISCKKDDSNQISTWIKNYGFEGYDYGNSIIKVSNNLLFIINHSGDLKNDNWVYKIDNKGNVIWNKNFSINRNDYLYQLYRIDDDNILIFGVTDNGSYTLFNLIKIDGNGSILWQKSYDFSGHAFPLTNQSLVGTLDGGFMLLGNYWKNSIKNIVVLKINKNGDEEWHKLYGNYYEVEAHAIRQVETNNFIITGYTRESDSHSPNIFLLKITGAGDIIFEKNISDNYPHIGNSLENSQNSFLLLATTYGNFPFSGLNLFKYSYSGDTLWSKLYGLPNDHINMQGSEIKQLKDENYIILGNSMRSSDRNNCLFLCKIDTSGKVIWNRNLDLADNIEAFSIIEIDEGFIIIGSGLLKNGYNENEVFILKLDKDGNL
jgi:hypothetical protein